ncbi:hypothetical protein [Hymenobacter glaciei]|uniref:hypothetical protein n=1 Tax=Hymenobacter glaciei TaxID=877209 RepID=UPI0031F00539
MQSLLPILIASVAGMGCIFEPDPLLAVGNLISRRNTLAEALRDGIYWDLGHTTTLVVVGVSSCWAASPSSPRGLLRSRRGPYARRDGHQPPLD